jgi:hypothetical protein
MSDYRECAKSVRRLPSLAEDRVRLRALFALVVSSFLPAATAQVSEFTKEMSRRLNIIAGERALDCGAVALDGDRNPKPALQCARRAIKKKIPF